MMKKYNAYIVCLLLVWQSVWAGDVFFEHIGISDGLPQMTVNDICCDEQGGMWFATRQGLVRYTGSVDEVYIRTAADTLLSFPSPVVDRVSTDGNGNIYRMAGNLTVYSQREGVWRTVGTESCDAMTTVDDGVDFVMQGSVYHYRSRERVIDTVLVLPTDMSRVSRMLRLDDALLLGTIDGGVYSYDGDRGTLMLLRSLGSHISDIYEDSFHRIWVSTWDNGLYCYTRSDQQKWVKQQGVSSSFVRTIVEDSQNTIWVGTEHGIENLSEPGRCYLEGESVWKLYRDEYGTIWVGTYFGGVYHFNPGISPYTRLALETEHFPVISSICPISDDAYYLCTEGQGLWRYTVGKGVTRRWQVPNIKTAYYEGSQGSLYIGTHLGGVYRLDEVSGRLYHYAMPCPTWPQSDIVRCIIPYQDSILVGTYNGLYVMPHGGGELRLFSESLHRQMPYIVTMAEDSQHRLWLGGYELVVYDREHDTVQKIPTPFNMIESLLVDYQGTVWIGTDGAGVWSYSPKTQELVEYSSANYGLQSDFIRRLLFTRRGNLMILTSRGFSILEQETQVLSNYHPGVYLPLSSIYNGGATVTQSGEILLAGMDGMLLFREEDLPSRDVHPRIVLNRLSVDAHEIVVGDESRVLPRSLPYMDTLSVGSGLKFLDIQLYVDNYAISAQEQIRYSTESSLHQWIYLTEKRPTIHLMNLPYGYSRLTIQVVDKHTEDVLSERAIAICRHTPWYRQAWFSIVLSMLLIGGLMIVFMRQERRVKKAIRSRDELLRDAFRSRVMQYVNAHLMDSELDVEALCKELGLGRSKLFRQIKEDFGVTPQHLIQETRLEKAAEWLQQRTDLNISEIAYDLGYQSPKYFARCFKDRYGITPTQYRKQHTDDGNV